MSHSPRIAFWGTPSLAVSYLDALAAQGMLPVVIITNPDRPKGRGHELTPTPVKAWALEHDIDVLQPEKLDDAFKEELSAFDLDVSIVVAYGSIIPKNIIDMPKHGTLNVHYSLLPRFRGAAPTEAAILAGDTETGSSIQIMRVRLDSGPIIAEVRTQIGPDETTTELRGRLTTIGAQLLVDTLGAYLAGQITPREQDEALATRSGKIQKEDGHIDRAAPAEENYRKYRAYIEWPRTFFFIQHAGKEMRVIITHAQFENGQFVIHKVLPEGKKEITYSDFLRSYES